MKTQILTGKQTGKTEKLIRRAAQNGLYIVVTSQQRAGQVMREAHEMGLKIPFPITIRDVTLRRFGPGVSNPGILIDDLDECLRVLLSNIPIHMASASTWEFTDGNGEELTLRVQKNLTRFQVVDDTGNVLFEGALNTPPVSAQPFDPQKYAITRFAEDELHRRGLGGGSFTSITKAAGLPPMFFNRIMAGLPTPDDQIEQFCRFFEVDKSSYFNPDNTPVEAVIQKNEFRTATRMGQSDMSSEYLDANGKPTQLTEDNQP